MTKGGEISTILGEWVWEDLEPDRMTKTSEPQTLSSRGLLPHILDFDDLLTAADLLFFIGRPSSTKKTPSIENIDHALLWAWTGDILVNTQAIDIFVSKEPVRLLTSLLCLKLHPELRYSTPHFHSHLVATVTSFTMLDAIIKNLCSDYIGKDGEVTKAFDACKCTNHRGKGRYNPGDRCSSLSILLKLYFHQVAEEEFTKYLYRGIAIKGYKNPCMLFDEIGKWRNSVLHGSESWTHKASSVLTLAAMICLYKIKTLYPLCRRKGYELAKREYGSPKRWSFYAELLFSERLPCWLNTDVTYAP